MTDDNNSRYRPSEPYSHDPASAPASAGQGSSDPLAELARLIGKNDPFAELGRSSHAPASHPPPRDNYREPRFDDPAPQADHYATDNQRHDLQRHDLQRHDLQRHDPQFPPTTGWEATAQPAPNFDPFAPHAQQAPLSADTRYEEHPYAVGSHASGQPQPVVDNYQPEHDPHQLDVHSGYDNENAARLGDVPGFGPPPFHPAESGAAQPSEDQFYDDAPPRSRKGLVTVAAVLVLAVVGTAAAFGYRSYRGGTGSLSLPTIIRASSEPTKVAPPAPAPSADASKISYDRFGDRGQNEKVVSREEQPVDQREIVRSSSVPRTVLPGAPTSSPNAGATAANNPPSNSNNAPSALGEPKRIRTVPIRPDQPDASAGNTSAGMSVAPKQVASLPAPPPQAAPQQPLQAAPLQAAPPPAPIETAPAPQRAAAPAPVERAPRAQRNAPPPANAPLSLAPDANASAAPAAQPAPRPAAPMQVASAPANGGTGRYHVQISSQRSEADAQNAFRSVQGKYSSVLGGQQAVIRKVELGEKGTYYRAMVGPFSSRDQAVQLCSSLKSAGGDCVVQSN
jgi:hypothetical protein